MEHYLTIKRKWSYKKSQHPENGSESWCLESEPSPAWIQRPFTGVQISISLQVIHNDLQDPTHVPAAGRRSLLKDEGLTISALQDLHRDLFPPLFKDAFSSKQPNLLREMVAAWSLPCLPVGALMKTPDLETLKAVLGGLDLLMTKGSTQEVETTRA
jgi:hypothetical protein